MSKFKVGDKVRVTRKFNRDGGVVGSLVGTVFVITEFVPGHQPSHPNASGWVRGDVHDHGVWEDMLELVVDEVQPGPVVPDYYAFPGGVRVHQISGHLTSFGGQAVQYIARSTRLDGQNKGDTAENLRKAIRFLELEIERVSE